MFGWEAPSNGRNKNSFKTWELRNWFVANERQDFSSPFLPFSPGFSLLLGPEKETRSDFAVRPYRYGRLPFN